MDRKQAVDAMADATVKFDRERNTMRMTRAIDIGTSLIAFVRKDPNDLIDTMKRYNEALEKICKRIDRVIGMEKEYKKTWRILKVKDITQTCYFCPSQWEGKLKDGKTFYMRYRFGTLSLGIGKNLDDAISNVVRKVKHGDKLDGTIDTCTALRLLSMEYKELKQ